MVRNSFWHEVEVLVWNYGVADSFCPIRQSEKDKYISGFPMNWTKNRNKSAWKLIWCCFLLQIWSVVESNDHLWWEMDSIWPSQTFSAVVRQNTSQSVVFIRSSWWSSADAVHYDFMKLDLSITAALYCSQLCKMMLKLKRKLLRQLLYHPNIHHQL